MALGQDAGVEDGHAYELDAEAGKLLGSPLGRPARSSSSSFFEVVRHPSLTEEQQEQEQQQQQQPRTLASRMAHELGRQCQMAGPLFVANFLSYSTSVVAVAFVGHLGDPQLLSSAVLANSLYNVTGYSIVSGLSAGMETLAGQAYGAKSYKTLGLVLQRALLITWLVCLPISLMWAHAEPLMLALGQKPAIARDAGQYLWTITPTLWMGATVECVKRYLLAQRVVVPGMAITAVTSALAPLYNYELIFRRGQGLAGAARAFVLSQGTACVLLLAYVAWRDTRMAARGHPEATWQWPSAAAFGGWPKYLGFAVPAAMMICLEWWTYEIVILLSGVTHDAELSIGVMGVAFQLSALAYMSSMALGSTANTRVSNALGAGRAGGAVLAVYTGAAAVVVSQTAVAAAAWLGRRAIVGALTSSEDVVAATLAVLPVLLPTFITDALNCVAQGVLRGAGRQGVGAAISVAAYWVFGVPLCYVLGLRMHLSVLGFWAGLLATSSGAAVLQFLVIARFDWAREVDRAAELNAEHEREAAEVKAALAAAGAAAAQPGKGAAAAAAAQGGGGGRRQMPRWWRGKAPEPRTSSSGSFDFESASLLGGARSSSADGSPSGGAAVLADAAWDEHAEAPAGAGAQQQQQHQRRRRGGGAAGPSRLGQVQGGDRHQRWAQDTAAPRDVRHQQQQQQQQQQPALEQQGSMARPLLTSCDSIDRG